jgi:arginyl-tRNA synthetase
VKWDLGKTRARLAWVEAIRVTYAQALSLVGVSAPDRMDRPADEEAAADES